MNSDNCKTRRKQIRQVRVALGVSLLLFSLTHSGCFSEDAPQPFYGRVVPPKTQEFRWSDGGIPQIFDPAFAAAPPDTDLVRAIFEGLTDYDPRTLQPVPAVATNWESSKDGREWTFYLRADARWSNGEPVTAYDFIQSWERTLKLGELAPHTGLLQNIEGASKARPELDQAVKSENNSASVAPKPRPSQSDRSIEFGAVAVSERVLRVRLERPDMNFPALVAHPVFRPVKVSDDTLKKIEPAELVSNGAFSLAGNAADRVLLARADNYWGKADVSLERVAFVDAKNTESALAAYRDGEVDAVTNVAFEPLAIKLLAPYEDFRRATYGAVTYYSFNTTRAPFDDVRVREALAIAIDRDRISQSEMGGATVPAKKFLPDEMTDTHQPVVGKADLLERDVTRARRLLEEAGFPDGNGFPKIRLVVNRNEQQRLVSQSIAAMWRTNLNVETEIVMLSWDEYEIAVRNGDYDMVRRGLVMQTTDEFININAMFQHDSTVSGFDEDVSGEPDSNSDPRLTSDGLAAREPVESEEQALRQLKAVPIYFAASYSLVKPYILGFNSNVLDAPSLKSVRIDTTWSEQNKGR